MSYNFEEVFEEINNSDKGESFLEYYDETIDEEKISHEF